MDLDHEFTAATPCAHGMIAHAPPRRGMHTRLADTVDVNIEDCVSKPPSFLKPDIITTYATHLGHLYVKCNGAARTLFTHGLFDFHFSSKSISYTLLILALGIVREPTVWGFITSKYIFDET